MTDDIAGLRNDIAFLRGLAEEGRGAPKPGGALLFTAGTAYGLASLASWALRTGLVTAPPRTYGMIWYGASAIFLAVLAVVIARRRATPNVRSPGQRAIRTAWTGVGWGIFTLMFAVGLVSWRAHSSVAYMLAPPIVLALYGVSWSVAAAVAKRRWIWVTAIGSYAGALLTAFLGGRPEALLVYAAAMVLLAAVPGVILMRQARRAGV
jgi:hypothetical protein